MDVINAAMAMCAGSVLLSLVVMVVAINLAYMARHWIRALKI